ncbi:hypothetical protein ACWCOP_13255 [Maricaulaceae bacterium MS644]
MDMAMRSFVLAAALALFAAAGVIGWNLLGGGFTAPWAGGGSDAETGSGSTGRIETTPGSLYDEFGEGDVLDRAPSAGQPGRVVIRSGSTGGSFDTRRPGTESGPRFDWSGSSPGSSPGADVYALSRETPADRVEADCRIRGGSSYGCRCLVRLARRDLSEAGFDFLSLANEPQPRGDRLQAAGLEARDLGALAGQLVRIDVEARRRCGASLAP